MSTDLSTADAADGPVRDVALRARAAARILATVSRADKDAVLLAAAEALERHTAEVLAANVQDLERARAAGATAATLDRLALDAGRVRGMAEGLRSVASLSDPVGEVVRGSTLASGIEMRQVRVPLGVVAIIFEGRPNVTADAAGLCLKAGNAVLLRGSSSATETNQAVVDVLRAALMAAELPADAVQQVPGAGRESAQALMRARGLVDVLVPRGGAGLIRDVVESSTVPVIETGVGNCHVYVDADADLDAAVRIILNAKAQRPSVCNAAETLLVHAQAAAKLLPMVLPALAEAGVTVHGDPEVAGYGSCVPATAADWDTEYLSLDLAVGIVSGLDAALAHIRAHGTGHTEAILTRSIEAAQRFTAEVDAAAVVVNASTRFIDGGELGFGGEIGISTQKLHARGPMGLVELTTTKYVLTGDGQIRT